MTKAKTGKVKVIGRHDFRGDDVAGEHGISSEVNVMDEETYTRPRPPQVAQACNALKQLDKQERREMSHNKRERAVELHAYRYPR